MARLFGVLLLVLVLLIAIAFLLPAQSETTRSIILQQTPEAIFTVLSDVQKMPEWNHHLEKIDMLPPVDGKEATRQTFKNGMVMTVVTTESLAPTHLVREEQSDLFNGSWTYDITPTNDGSKVALTEKAEIKNRFIRLMMRLSGAHKHIDEHLIDLAQHFGENARPK